MIFNLMNSPRICESRQTPIPQTELAKFMLGVFAQHFFCVPKIFLPFQIGNICQPTPPSLISLMDIGQMSLRQVASLTSSISALCGIAKYVCRQIRQDRQE